MKDQSQLFAPLSKALSPILTVAMILLLFNISPISAQKIDIELAKLRPDTDIGFSNGGWAADRYKDLDQLNAGHSMVVADLKGPGVITHIHTTRHHPEALLSRGIVIEIYFDGEEEPAVRSPLADFFGDGCNGQSTYFSAQLIECAPWSYNAYIPMPFKESAKVILRNDTERNVLNYSYVEWETLPEWDPSLGYFHATYARKSFQLTKDSRVTFFETEGRGHIIGRQFSVISDDPYFRDFNTVMEGNNEIDIDGKERKLDYLGTEDSFTFSWGFNEEYAGIRSGMPFVSKTNNADTTLNLLSIYRFHNHMPISYNSSIKWTIDWSNETVFTTRKDWPGLVEDGCCWVDYATVHYWYSDHPAGYKHEPMLPVEKRQMQMLQTSKKRK